MGFLASILGKVRNFPLLRPNFSFGSVRKGGNVLRSSAANPVLRASRRPMFPVSTWNSNEPKTDWRHRVYGVRNQGPFDVCAYFACVTVVGCVMVRKFNFVVRTSDLDLWVSNMCEQSKPHMLFTQMSTEGLILGKDFSWNIDELSWPSSYYTNYKRTIGCKVIYAVRRHVQLSRNEESLVRHMKYKGPFCVGLSVGPRFRGYKGGLYIGEGKQFTDHNLVIHTTALHAVAVVAMNVTYRGSRCWVLQNSWGPDWGASGLLYVPMKRGVFNSPIFKEFTGVDIDDVAYEGSVELEKIQMHKWDLAGPENAFGKCKTLVKDVNLTGSASAEVIADVPLCSLEAVKVRVQTELGFARGMSDGFPKFVRADGVSRLYMGLVPQWGRQSPSSADTMMRCASFEMLYKHAIPTPKSECSKPFQLCGSFAGGNISGVLCVIFSHPADNLVSFHNDAKEAAAGVAVMKLVVWGLFTRELGTLTRVQWGIYNASTVFVGLPTTRGNEPSAALPESARV